MASRTRRLGALSLYALLAERVLRRLDADLDRLSGHRRARRARSRLPQHSPQAFDRLAVRHHRARDFQLRHVRSARRCRVRPVYQLVNFDPRCAMPTPGRSTGRRWQQRQRRISERSIASIKGDRLPIAKRRAPLRHSRRACRNCSRSPRRPRRSRFASRRRRRAAPPALAPVAPHAAARRRVAPRASTTDSAAAEIPPSAGLGAEIGRRAARSSTTASLAFAEADDRQLAARRFISAPA